MSPTKEALCLKPPNWQYPKQNLVFHLHVPFDYDNLSLEHLKIVECGRVKDKVITFMSGLKLASGGLLLFLSNLYTSASTLKGEVQKVPYSRSSALTINFFA